MTYAALAACLAALVYLGSVYLPLAEQAVFAYTVFGLCLVLRKARFVQDPPWRIAFLLLATFLSVRYWLWRASDTLIYTGPLDLAAMLLLFAAETHGMAVHFLGAFVSAWPLRREPAPLPEDPSLLPTVDVFLPTYNESDEILRITATACTQLDYPPEKLRVWILDDGGTDARCADRRVGAEARDRRRRLTRLAAELGIGYLTRPDNAHAKAGNLNHALQQTDGELVLFLDADHVPAQDLLRHTVGGFLTDPKLFLVQTPHFFVNPDPVEKNLATFADAPGENEMFYRAIQPGLDFWNASFFCGSAAVMRRRFLEEAGGISGKTITEDAETALGLHARGYHSAFVGRPMICGLSPESFDDFILQRSRWAQGMTQILVTRRPFLARGLRLAQRLCYTNSSVFWLFGFTRLVYFLAPAAYLLFGLKVYHASVPQVLAYAIPHALCALVMADFLYGKVRWPFFGEIYESVQSVFLVPAVTSALVNPRRPTFKVTPKGKSLANDFLSPLAGPFYLLFFLLLATFPAAAIRWTTVPADRDVVAICVAWSAFNFLYSLACLGVIWERRQRRHFHRFWARGRVAVVGAEGGRWEGELSDLSLSGAGLALDPGAGGPGEGAEVTLEARDSYGRPYCLAAVVERAGGAGAQPELGLAFRTPGPEGFAERVRFVYGDSQRWVDLWEHKARRLESWQALGYLGRKGLAGVVVNFTGVAELAAHTLGSHLAAALRLGRRDPEPSQERTAA